MLFVASRARNLFHRDNKRETKQLSQERLKLLGGCVIALSASFARDIDSLRDSFATGQRAFDPSTYQHPRPVIPIVESQMHFS
jgi:hypothetical protein